MNSKNYSKAAFTLAEVLITLGVIGIVAAMTLPALIQNYQRKQYAAQLKKSYTVVQNAFRTAMAEDGVEDIGDTTLWQSIPADITTVNITDSTDQDFVNNLKKYLNIVGIENHSFQYDVSYLTGEEDAGVHTGAIRLADGSMLTGFGFYKSGYTPSDDTPQGVKARGGKLLKNYGDFAIDINSNQKKPNKYGVDIFHFVIGQDGMLYPAGGKDYAIFSEASANISNYTTSGYYWDSPNTEDMENTCNPKAEIAWGWNCAARVMEENWEINY